MKKHYNDLTAAEILRLLESDARYREAVDAAAYESEMEYIEEVLHAARNYSALRDYSIGGYSYCYLQPAEYYDFCGWVADESAVYPWLFPADAGPRSAEIREALEALEYSDPDDAAACAAWDEKEDALQRLADEIAEVMRGILEDSANAYNPEDLAAGLGPDFAGCYIDTDDAAPVLYRDRVRI